MNLEGKDKSNVYELVDKLERKIGRYRDSESDVLSYCAVCRRFYYFMYLIRRFISQYLSLDPAHDSSGTGVEDHLTFVCIRRRPRI